MHRFQVRAERRRASQELSRDGQAPPPLLRKRKVLQVRRHQPEHYFLPRRRKKMRQKVFRVLQILFVIVLVTSLVRRPPEAFLHVRRRLVRQRDAARRALRDVLVENGPRFGELRLARERARRVLDSIVFRVEAETHVVCGAAAGGKRFEVSAVRSVREHVGHGARAVSFGVKGAQRRPQQVLKKVRLATLVVVHGRVVHSPATTGILGGRRPAAAQARPRPALERAQAPAQRAHRRW
mmetsp:Transcript_1483/g.4479  ORF Transcript_1483/g.4479 Transcript_1483/m.4479 type:complete len:238 (-) Transcript_1483:45-758(-)